MRWLASKGGQTHEDTACRTFMLHLRVELSFTSDLPMSSSVLCTNEQINWGLWLLGAEQDYLTLIIWASMTTASSRTTSTNSRHLHWDLELTCGGFLLLREGFKSWALTPPVVLKQPLQHCIKVRDVAPLAPDISMLAAAKMWLSSTGGANPIIIQQNVLIKNTDPCWDHYWDKTGSK